MKVGGNDDVVLPFDNNDDNDNNGNNDNDFYPHINEVDCDNDIDDNSDNDNNYNNDNNDNNIWTMTPMITMKMNFFLTILLFPPPRGCAARCSWFTRVSHNTWDERNENRGRKNEFSQRGSCSVLPERCVSLWRQAFWPEHMQYFEHFF